MKTLVLAEKPSVGKDIARVLGCRQGGNGYLEGDKYVVTWALGHLVTLADPEAYNAKYKAWNMNDLPIMPEKLELTVIPQSSKQYHVVKSQLYRKDIHEVVIATDAGREGELVARWILEKAKVNKNVKRLWISSVTDKAIRDGFRGLKDGKEYLNLCYSAKARAEADWLVGINATRALTVKYNTPLSCGRVQTPTVAIIAKREEEIRSFKPRPYYGLSAFTGTYHLTWQDKNTKDTRSFDKEKIDALLQKVASCRKAKVTAVDKSMKKMYPPRLYDLTELQRDANRRFGFSPKETLSIMQKLYEHHKVLTYPRTDSRYITKDIVPTIQERLKASAAGPYAKMCKKLAQGKITANANFVDDSKVSDHHAIIPTEEPVSLQGLNEKERKVYDLVITRFLAVLYPPFEYEQVSVKVDLAGEIFTAKGKRVLSQGFKEVYAYDEEQEEGEEKDQAIPPLNQGSMIDIQSVKMTEGKTKPPAPFNEATLLSAMENPAKYMDKTDKQLAKTLGETGGLGTVATRADIIEKLFDTFYIEKRGKDIFTTSKGRQLLKLAPKDLKSPEMTGEWEEKLSRIAKGKLKKEEFLRDIRHYTKDILIEIKNSTETFRHDNLTNQRCPECGKFMLQVNGKKGKMLVCQDRECGFRKQTTVLTNARCPVCHKKMEIIGEGPGKKVVCVCGHRENYDTFAKRKKAEGNQLSKKEAERFLKEMNKKDEGNHPLADALKGFKFDNEK